MYELSSSTRLEAGTSVFISWFDDFQISTTPFICKASTMHELFFKGVIFFLQWDLYDQPEDHILHICSKYPKAVSKVSTLGQSSRPAALLYIKCLLFFTPGITDFGNTLNLQNKKILCNTSERTVFSKYNPFINFENICMNMLQLSITPYLHSDYNSKRSSSVLFFIMNYLLKKVTSGSIFTRKILVSNFSHNAFLLLYWYTAA